MSAFDKVIGYDTIKNELRQVCDMISNKEVYENLGARMPNGLLLHGEPGLGKTLLAKCFIEESGLQAFTLRKNKGSSDFINEITETFRKAKENAPCIVFVDEIDAVGRQRGTGIGGGNDEREQTLNQLLTEMDGFEGNTGIIVIAATNRADILDSALLRPGRFDRQVRKWYHQLFRFNFLKP